MNSDEHLFISDVHLGAFSEEENTKIENHLIALVEYATHRRCSLYVLGDLFDYWMEYQNPKYVPKLGERVLDTFEVYNKTVKPAIFVTGNHDNWTCGHFKERGFDVESKARVLDIDSQKVLIMHGDGMFGVRDDFLRPKFHQILRSTAFVKSYQAIFPPILGNNIMKAFSGIASKRNHLNPIPLNVHAKQIVHSKEIDLVLCGHDHIPRMETFPKGSYINLGTFFKHKTLVRYIGGTFSLVVWQPETKDFVPYGH